MKNNTKVAKELVRIAKSLIAFDGQDGLPILQEQDINQHNGIADKPGEYENFTGIIKFGGIFGHVKNATFSLIPKELDNCLIFWQKGTWENGLWQPRKSLYKKCIWENGTWKDGTMENTAWMNGTWEDGVFISGTWYRGTWKDGLFQGGNWNSGTWENGQWKSGLWNGGTWKHGIDKHYDEHEENDSPDKWDR